MNFISCFGTIVILVLVNIVSANGLGAGALGQRPRCKDATGLPIADALLNPVLQSPCELVTCLLNFTCQSHCESPLLTSVLGLIQGLLVSPVCDRGLVVCPDNLAVEKCLSPSGRKSILGL